MSETTTRDASHTPDVALPHQTGPHESAPARGDDLRAHLVDTLTAGRHLTSARWRAAFRSVPRERFFGRFGLPSAHGLGEHDLTIPEHRGVGLAAVYTDNALHARSEISGSAQGLSPAPSLLATMLEQLAAQPGDRVLEVGASGGYHAALLCEAIGDGGITALEAASAEATRAALSTSGYSPTVVGGDLDGGFAPGAPYDRLLATCETSRVPANWVKQLRTGGVLVAAVGSGIARLTVRDDGSADGPFLRSTGLAPLRARTEETCRDAPDTMTVTGGTGISRGGPAIPRGIFTDPAVQFLFALHHPALRQVILDTADGTEYRLHDPARGRWVRARPDGPGRVAVTRGGCPGDLWQELASLVVTWNDHGRPRVDRFGLTVRPDGTHLLWLDERAHPVAAL